ncbi:hypothetical protein G3I40_39195 [Streptomyces sp. SID14478]|uniref:helicase-associated domain-containing protein n=1 Tax=Streptomyces sp. SID14478 TaxID=2706073 RepID=UPI0013E003DA|nr:helicase-associated domain-containing protein [Streptomyces sp. SID14478]NEB81192.1 hypothetical protein [Streptomyces sp. SID14478]
MNSRSPLVTWLRGLDRARLARVLEMRRDVASPPEPRSVGELADRLQRPGSVAHVLPRLALPHLEVAEAVAALGAPASRDALTALLGVVGNGTARELDASLEALADHALVWPDDAGTLHMAEPLRQAWDAPLGLDAPLEQLLARSASEELRRILAQLGIKPPATKSQRLAALVRHHSDPVRVTALVAKAPAATRELLARRAEATAGEPEFTMFGAPGSDRGTGERWAWERGLLIPDPHGYGQTRMPAEVALALRGPGWHAPFHPAPPSVPLVPVTSPEVNHEASVAATVFGAHAAAVLSVCSASAPARLRSGGVGARELARIGKAAQVDDAVVRLTLEIAYAAGLLRRDGDRVVPTEAYGAWTELEPPEQFALLLRTWRDLPLTATRARDEDNRALPALAGAPPCEDCVRTRHGMLAAFAQLPVGRGARIASELGPLIGWLRPLAESPPQDSVPFATVIQEAELLGVIARGALSDLGAHVRVHDAEGLGAECRRLLPTAVTTARIGADLTAVVTGTPSARLSSLLDSVADREASGAASLWRFSSASIRRALDDGLDAEGIQAELAAVAGSPLPQPLSYLIADTARGHGRVRIAPAACVLHSDEPALLAELAVHRGLVRLRLRHLAPTVLVSHSPLDTTLAALRAEGFAPVAETDEGVARVDRLPPQRDAAPAAAPLPSPGGIRTGASGRIGAARPARQSDAVEPDDLAARLLAAPTTIPDPAPFDGGRPFASDTEEIVAGGAKGLRYSDVRQLAHAIDSGRALTIEYVAASGRRTVRTLSDLTLDPPFLEAWCHLRDAERVFTLSRIQSVMPEESW